MIRLLRWSFISIFFSAFCGGIFYSCNKEEPIPAYIHIDKIDVTSDLLTQGTASHSVVDAWVYVDEQLIGAFELPVTFPVITTEGTHSIKIFGGIKIDGISSLRIAYPFYDSYNTSVNLTPGVITTLTPTVAYYSGITFPSLIPWIEDMSGPGISLIDTLGDTPFQLDTSNPLEGQYVKATFSSADTSMLLQSNNFYLLSTSQNAIFLELNYKSTTDFFVGLRNAAIPNVTNSFLTINSSGGVWKKIYVNLTDKFAGIGGSTNYFIYFGKINLDGNANGTSIQLDNIKLIKN